mmetsp:Transcript_67695/g.117802  ORF Transcript_67695/g.117802 Transcript_67695/m.117802 type:complete len:295 (-) Transcript_67695:60-944(-)
MVVAKKQTTDKKPTKRQAPRKGYGAAKAKVVHKDAEEVVEQPTLDGIWPADPVDPRLTLAGLKMDGSGKIDLDAYNDLMDVFKREPAPDQHPDPSNPGVRAGEKIPKGLRNWDDVRAGAFEKDGAGWIASRSATQHEPSKTKWFNIRLCGSWRMAFLLARLQRLHWDERSAWVKSSITSPAGHESKQELPKSSVGKHVATGPSSASNDPEEKAADEDAASSTDKAVDTPKAKRARSAPAEGGTAQKKRPRQGEPKDTQAPLPALKTKLIDPSAVATSVRLQQILARQQLQKPSQ